MPRLEILLSAVLVLLCEQTDRQTESHREVDDDDYRVINDAVLCFFIMAFDFAFRVYEILAL